MSTADVFATDAVDEVYDATIASAIYAGSLRHRRFDPVQHEFRNPLFLMYVDLDELPLLFENSLLWSADRPALAWFRRGDHFGDPSVPLDEAVRQLVAERTGTRPRGPIRLLTHFRYFGYVFNPLSVYYCFGPDGRTLETVVGEVCNTPWGERHLYVLQDPLRGRLQHFRHAKEFHVSPLMPMDLEYDWRVTVPGQQLAIQITTLHDGQPNFDATLVLRRREISPRALTAVLVQYPFMTAQVIATIHWQALRLWLKGAKYHPHPGRGGSSAK